MLDELRYEWRRLQTFVDWPLDRPRPAELAKAGFFFAPSKEEPDRCAHFCSDKFFSAWEPEDDPWDVLRANCPESPFVHGMSDNVPLPSAYVPGAAKNANDESDDDESAAGAAAPGPAGGAARKGSGLRDYLSNAISKVASSAEGLAAARASQVVAWVEGLGYRLPLDVTVAA